MLSARVGSVVLVGSLALVGIAVGQTPIVSPSPRYTLVQDKCMCEGTMRLSRLLDATVYDDAGRDVGHIKDIALDVTQDKVSYFALSHGIAGTFDRKVLAVPYAAMRFGTPTDGRLYVQAGAKTLDKTPGFDASASWPTGANAAFYASNDPSLKKAMEQTTASETAMADHSEMAQKAAATMNPAMAAPWSRRASEWIGKEVLSANGDQVGKIEDLVLCCDGGAIAYACIEENSAFNADQRYIAVPISQFHSQPDSKRLVLNVGSSEIKATPGFDKDHWPMAAASKMGAGAADVEDSMKQ